MSNWIACEWEGRVHRVLEKSLKVLEFGEKNSRPLKVLEKSLNLNVSYIEILAY